MIQQHPNQPKLHRNYDGDSIKAIRVNRKPTNFSESISESPVKQSQRETILEEMCSFFNTRKIRLLSLPGEQWKFENMLLDRHPNSGFMCFEYNSLHYERGVFYRPRLMEGRKRPLRLDMVCELGRFDAIQFGDDRFFFHADINTFLSGEIIPEGWTLKTWRHFTAINSLWIDPLSPLGSPFYESVLSNLYRPLIYTKIFAAFSFIIGRDTGKLSRMISISKSVFGDALISRVEVIREILGKHRVRFIPEKMWTHRVHDNAVTMGTVTGIVCRLRKGQII